MATLTRGWQNRRKRLLDYRNRAIIGIDRIDNSLIGHFGCGMLSYPINCDKCGVLISPAHSNQKYCKKCSYERLLERGRKYAENRKNRRKDDKKLDEYYLEKQRNNQNRLNWSKEIKCSCGKNICKGSTMCLPCSLKARGKMSPEEKKIAIRTAFNKWRDKNRSKIREYNKSF